MTSHNFQPTAENRPYRRYLDATHAARDAYLATTYHAHRQYLTGPWPDREHYQQVENYAWQVYYAAARTAWQRYTAELTQPETPPDHSAAPPIPVYPTDHRTDQEARASWQPTITPNQEGAQ